VTVYAIAARISAYRHAGADTVVLLVQALPGKGAQ
jgi:hypothetical protein